MGDLRVLAFFGGAHTMFFLVCVNTSYTTMELLRMSRPRPAPRQGKKKQVKCVFIDQNPVHALPGNPYTYMYQ